MKYTIAPLFSNRQVGLTRRQILRSVGLTGAAAAAGPLVFSPVAQAADIPKRLIVFHRHARQLDTQPTS
jgi:hypothetical protein